MDFSVEGWAVGKAAEDLNSSLFSPALHQGGAAKKKQKHQKKTPTKNKSDDGKTEIIKNVVSTPILDSKHIDMQKKNEKLINGGKKSKNFKKKDAHKVAPPGEDVPVVSDGGKGRVEKRLNRVVAESPHSQTQCSHGNSNKRKAQQGENPSPSKKQKNTQQIPPMDNQNTHKGEKRKKKKKNSNKRNKYKHLSVKKSEPECVDDKVCGSVTVLPPGDGSDGKTVLGTEQTNVKCINTPDTGGNVSNNKDVLLGNQDRKKKDKNTDPLLKQKKKKREKTVLSEKDLVQPGVQSNKKQGKERVNEKFQVKVLNKMLSASPSVSKQSVQVESKKSGESTPSLKQRMLDKLKAARFRFLNEQLYSQTGSESYSMFEEDKEAFQVYHQGFQSQVAKWPVNPVSVIIGQLKARPRNLVIADFGCGDAVIASTLPNKVHSFDLVATNSHVTACDMAKVPLKNESIDVAVFCLSLMGKNLPDYLREASRVLKPGGSLKVAEVTSRIRSLPHFKNTMNSFGFRLLKEDTTNRMFCLFDFKKGKLPKNPPEEFQLEPCLYKRR